MKPGNGQAGGPSGNGPAGARAESGQILGRVASVNVGLARTVEWRNRRWTTGIFKEPVSGPVRVEGVQVAGDQQADPSVHGGPSKSVYAYPHEHYAFWAGALPERQARVLDVPGAFGENLTTEGLLERDVGVGDRLRVGTALLRVTEPRMPCSKLGLRFRDPLMTRRFHESGRNGFYLAIEEPGEVAAGDVIVLESAFPDRLTTREIVEFYTGRDPSPGLRARALAHGALSTGWKDWFAEQEEGPSA